MPSQGLSDWFTRPDTPKRVMGIGRKPSTGHHGAGVPDIKYAYGYSLFLANEPRRTINRRLTIYILVMPAASFCFVNNISVDCFGMFKAQDV